VTTQPVRVQVRGPRALAAIVPHLLGFHPDHSLVIVAVSGPHGRVHSAFRFDLPDPPDPSEAAAIAGHTIAVLRGQRLTTAVALGYGPGTQVTPVADILRVVLPEAGIQLRDILRVHESRCWSYLCPDPTCCPPDGIPVGIGDHPAATALAMAGLPAAASRAVLASTIAPLRGPDAYAMREATVCAERAAAERLASHGQDALDDWHLTAVKAAIACYRTGEGDADPDELAILSVGLTSLRVRDDAWARMDPSFQEAHVRLWTDLTRRAQPGYVAAPASLLAFTAWQGGEGALANLALDRALADDPGYSMAHLLRDALAAALPPSAARLPMTPEEVAASYEALRRDR